MLKEILKFIGFADPVQKNNYKKICEYIIMAEKIWSGSQFLFYDDVECFYIIKSDFDISINICKCLYDGKIVNLTYIQNYKLFRLIKKQFYVLKAKNF